MQLINHEIIDDQDSSADVINCEERKGLLFISDCVCFTWALPSVICHILFLSTCAFLGNSINHMSKLYWPFVCVLNGHLHTWGTVYMTFEMSRQSSLVFFFDWILVNMVILVNLVILVILMNLVNVVILVIW